MKSLVRTATNTTSRAAHTLSMIVYENTWTKLWYHNSSMRKHISVPKQSPKKHWHQGHCIRKWPHKSMPFRSVLHTKIQTCPQLPRAMQQIRGSFILITTWVYLETHYTLTLTHYNIRSCYSFFIYSVPYYFVSYNFTPPLPNILSLFTHFYFT